MKKLSAFVIGFTLLGLFACNNAETKDTASKEVKGKSTHIAEGDMVKPMKIGKQEFITKIFNYEANTTDWVFEGDRPCVIDFYADWCAPCKQVAPILDELALTYEGKVDFYKINVDEQKELAQVFGIQSIPTFYFVPVTGQPKASMGAMPKASFVQGIEDIINNN